MNAAQPRAGPAACSDEDLACMAQSALAWNLELALCSVTASAADGWLTLSGEVLWHYQRQDAAECVRYLPGLAGVCNEIKLRAPYTGPEVKDAP